MDALALAGPSQYGDAERRKKFLLAFMAFVASGFDKDHAQPILNKITSTYLGTYCFRSVNRWYDYYFETLGTAVSFIRQCLQESLVWQRLHNERDRLAVKYVIDYLQDWLKQERILERLTNELK
jgi:hypothetical protein